MTEITLGGLIAMMALPSAITGFCFWLLERQIKKRDRRIAERDEARKENELLLIKSTGAAIELGEVTARAVQRIPDAHCNGDMDAALANAERIKREQKDFLARQGINALYN